MVDAFSSLFTIAVMVGAGYIGGNSIEVLKRDITRIEHIAILLGIVLLIFYLFFRYFRYVKSRQA
jgi:membrane protein DedA with SNARE-associated domain